MTQQAELIVVGRITGVYGVRGALKVISHTSPPENLLDYRGWHVQRQGRWQPLEVSEAKPHGKGLVVSLPGLSDRDEARAFVGLDIAVPRAELPPLPDDEFYWTDLEGLRVLTVDGAEIGVVDHVLETGSNDVLVVVQDGKPRTVPFLRGSVVKNVDLAAGTITVDWDFEF